MKRDLALLGSCEFDLLVVGGGIFGACAALDAVQRGLSVALIDRSDFSSATSANCFKLIHGGIRYLQHADLPRVRESAHARRTFIRIAPHLAYPLPIVVPTYGHGVKGKEAMRLAMGIYDAVTCDRNRGISDPCRRIPRGYCLSRREVLERFPGLETRGLTGAAVFYDGQMYNPTRLVLAFLRSAAEEGAIVANYLEAVKLIRQGHRVCGVEVRDGLGGGTSRIRAKTVLNAAGPYAEAFLEGALGERLRPKTPWSRDAYFVVPSRLVKGKEALAVPAATKDPGAVLSRGERHLFLVPWRKYTLVGVWHKVYEGHPDAYTVSETELLEFIAEINSGCPDLKLTREDVSLWNAGLIPFGENDNQAGDLQFAHRSRLVDHEQEHGVEGLVTLIGVRYTTGPCEAAKAIDLIVRKLARRAPPSRLHVTPLYGGRIQDFEALVQQVQEEVPKPCSADATRALVHNYGSAYTRVLDYVQAKPELGQTIDSSTVLKAEVLHAIREEMAQTLSDVVFRRTDLGTGEYPTREALEVCAELMSGILEWDAARKSKEIDQVMATFPACLRSGEEQSPRRPARSCQAGASILG